MINKEVVDEVYKKLGRNFDNLFELCDTNKDGCVNILDIKSGLKGVLFNPKDAKLINPFVAQVKKIFKTSLIDKSTFTKFFKLYDRAALYREAMIKLKDQIDVKEGKSNKMENALSANASAKGILSKEGLAKAISSQGLGIEADIVKEIVNDIEKRHQLLNIKDIMTYISTASTDSEDVNAVTQAVDLVSPVVKGITMDSFDFIRQMLEPKLKAINNSRFD